MTSPEEEQKRAAEAKARESASPEKPGAPTGDAFTLVGQLVADAKNIAVDAVAGQHSGDKVLSGITPQLAAQYERGKELQERLASGAIKPSQLNDTDKNNLAAFNNVRKTISQVPLYDRDSLMRYVEKGIEQKATRAPIDAARAPGPDAGKVSSHDAAKPAARDVSKPTTPDLKTAGHEGAKLNSHDATKTAVHDTSSPPAERAKAAPSGERESTEKLIANPGGSQSHLGFPVAREIPQVPASRPDLSIINTSPPDTHISKPAYAKAQDVSTGNVAPLLGKSAEPSANIRNSETREQKTLETGSTASSNFESVLRKSSNSQISIESRSPAISTFERRTGYDAVAQFQVKGETGKLIRDEPRQESKQIGQESRPSTGFARAASFENMRRVLDERSAIASNQIHNERFIATEKYESRKEAYELKPRLTPKHTDGAVRLTLAEVANCLPLHRLQQIVRYSQERFSSGLRWQNSLRNPDVSPPARTHHQAGEIQQPRAAQKADFLPPSSLSTPSRSGPRRLQESGSGAKPFQDGQSWGAREPALKGEGVKTFSLRGRVQDRYITGAEIALAAIIAAAGAKRLRYDELNPPSGEFIEQMPRVQKIDAFSAGLLQPEKTKQDRGAKGQTSDSVSNFTANIKVDSRTNSLANITRSQTSSGGQPSENVSAKGGAGETESGKFIPSQKRFITGAEIALATVIASCGTARIRRTFAEKSDEQTPGNDERLSMNTSGSVETDRALRCEADETPGTMRYLQTHKYNRTTRLIGPHETFVSIAESLPGLFCDGGYGWLIADINLPRIKETFVDGKRIVEVRSRQLIEIPCMADIVAFNRSRKEWQRPENLITVVIETQVDRELLNEHFGVFVEGSAKPAATGAAGSPVVLGGHLVGADAAEVLPPFAFQSVRVLRTARQQLIDIALQILETGRKPLAKFRNSLRRERIKRNF